MLCWRALFSLLYFFSWDLQNFKFWYVNCKAFGTSFLYWVDFKENLQNKYIVLFFVNCWIVFNCLLIYCYWLKWRFRKLTQLPPSFLQTSKYLPLTIQDSAIATVRLQVLVKKSTFTKKVAVQLNEYETAPNFIRSQNFTSDCLLI